jgi:hypothetical protein
MQNEIQMVFKMKYRIYDRENDRDIKNEKSCSFFMCIIVVQCLYPHICLYIVVRIEPKTEKQRFSCVVSLYSNIKIY